MKFFIRSGRNANADEYPHVVLTKDDWDDFGYKTTFRAVLYLEGETLELGDVKILHIDQTSGYTTMPAEPFESLDQNYCSLGADLGYYEKLFKCGPDV